LLNIKKQFIKEELKTLQKTDEDLYNEKVEKLLKRNPFDN
jgi:hypothetical protein